MKKHIVLVLDEATENHAFIKTGLEQVYGNEMTIIINEPLRTIENMISHIQKMSENLAVLILDERLHETGVCDYVGSELAKAYRSFDTKIPIYILTSYPDTVDKMSGDIEYVIDKSDLTEDPLIEKLSPKLRRHVDIYRDMVDARKIRLDELLVKHIKTTITAVEIQELEDLQFWRSRPIELEESMLSSDLKTSLDEKEKILDKLEDFLNKKN